MMFHSIDFSIQGEYLEMGGKRYLLGELTTDILNIPSAEYREMEALYKEGAWPELHALLLQREFFRLNLSRNELLEEDEYFEILHDIYAFNQTMFWFIDHFLMRLKKLDAENYAAALYDFITHPGAEKMIVNPLRDGSHVYTFADDVSVSYEPRERTDRPGEYAIYEVCCVNGLQGFLKMDFMRALMVGHGFRRCRNCKRFFLSVQGYHTEYCDRPLEDNPKLTCRNRGAKNREKEKAANNPVIRSYRLAYQRMTADKRRGRISEEDWKNAKAYAADLRDMALSGRLSDRELDKRLQAAALYGALGIQRRGGR